ncbi:MAG: helix-turn-helix domain-containing protein [Castellaniella sp.]|uniref:helix-turn-helix domain-containing protein n=1 Tax=Castellaniella sp. TaxID=1955812 RepID=UPI003A886837
MASPTPAPPARDHTAIPIYKLYGYGNVWTASDPLYCETIAAQEKLHDWHVTAHKHADLFQALFLESGEVTVMLDGRTSTLGPGRLVLVPQRVVHEFIFRPGSGGYILTLTYALLHGLCVRFGLGLSAATDPAVLTLGEDEAGRHAALSLHRLDHEYRGLHSPQRGPLLESLLSGILVWIHRQGYPAGTTATGTDPGSQHLAHYARMIEEHHPHQHQVAWYARHIGVTPAHLNTIVQALAGKSALELIHERLLLEARRELIYTPRTIGTISDSLGFTDPGYFTRFFKRLTGVSPKDFRRQALAPGTDQATGS